jgi:hypothetical protein
MSPPIPNVLMIEEEIKHAITAYTAITKLTFIFLDLSASLYSIIGLIMHLQRLLEVRVARVANKNAGEANKKTAVVPIFDAVKR